MSTVLILGATVAPTQEEFDRLMHTSVLGAMQAIPQVAPMVEAAKGRFAFLNYDGRRFKTW